VFNLDGGHEEVEVGRLVGIVRETQNREALAIVNKSGFGQQVSERVMDDVNEFTSEVNTYLQMVFVGFVP